MLSCNSLNCTQKLLSKIEKFNDLMLIAVLIQVKDYKLISNVFGKDVYIELLNNLRNVLENKFDINNVYIYKDDRLVLLLEVDSAVKKTIKKTKRKIKKIKLTANNLDIGELELVLGIAHGKKEYILRNSEIALNYAKKNNLKNIVYNQTLIEQLKNELEKKVNFEKIKKSIEREDVFPYYQKIVDNNTMEVFKYEALARIHHEDKILTPYHFTEAVKQLGLSDTFTRIIIKKVFKDVYDYKKINSASININIYDIKNKTTCDLIEQNLIEYGGERITFEVIETTGIEDYSVMSNFVKMIKKYGAYISIDDFGSGHSGYEHLINLDVDYLKIDGKFISIIKESKKTRELLEGLCNYAKNQKIKIIAEYVEDKQTFEILKSIGISYSQGYYFGKPTYI